MARDRRSNSKSAGRRSTAAAEEEDLDPQHRAVSTWIDYKDVNLLRRFMSERAKIRARRVTGNSAQQQRAGRARDPRRARDGAAAVQRAPGHAAQGRRPSRPRRPRATATSCART